jgi:hypothetical protein
MGNACCGPAPDNTPKKGIMKNKEIDSIQVSAVQSQETLETETDIPKIVETEVKVEKNEPEKELEKKEPEEEKKE